MEELFGCRPTCATPHLRLPRRARLVFGSLRTQATPHTAAATGLRLLLGSCESCGGHSYSQHKIAPHLWRRNPSPNLRRCRCCSVAGHNHRPKKLGQHHTWLGRLRRPTKHPRIVFYAFSRNLSYFMTNTMSDCDRTTQFIQDQVRLSPLTH